MKRTEFKIQRVWAFVAIDPDDPTGDEGIPAFQAGNVAMPMIAADPKRMEDLKKVAQQMANQQKIKISLRQFSEMKEIEVIEPK